jgi:hypothetical protein
VRKAGAKKCCASFIWRDGDVVKVAVRLWDGSQRMRAPNGGEGDTLVGKDGDIKATDERVGSRKLVAAVKGGGSEGEVKEMENTNNLQSFEMRGPVILKSDFVCEFKPL